jgi:hypothetical protein
MNCTKFFSLTWKTAIVSFAVLLSTFVGNTARAQGGININLYGSYVFDDKFDTYYSSSSYFEGKIKGGFQWGIGVEYMVHPEYGVELLYYRQDTKAPTRYYGVIGGGTGEANLDLAINYIMLAPTKHFLSSNEKVEGFAGLMAGMVIAEASTPDATSLGTGEDSATKFAWGLRLGGIIWASEKVGVRLQTQLLSATQAMGGGFYFGTGGAGAGVSSYSTIYQFGLGGGLVFKVK